VPTELHPAVEPVAWLLGTWSGRGHGEYPTIEPFDYDETITFTHVGKPFLVYVQRTRHAVDGRPLHGETGYWRPVAPDHIELVIAHPNGLVEVSEGSIAPAQIAVRSTLVAGTRTAKDVGGVDRTFTLDGDTLRYDLAMAAVGVAMTHHLHADLQRVDAS